jgi:hypothetical protein
MAVTASLVIQFGQDAQDGALLIAEVDSRPVAEGGLNRGLSQFAPGDTAHFLVYQYLVDTVTYTASAGRLQIVKSGLTRQIEETVTFLNELDGSVRLPIYSLDSVEWLGNNLGAILATGGTALRASTLGVGVAIVKYTTRYSHGQITAPAQINGRDAFDIVVLIEGA